MATKTTSQRCVKSIFERERFINNNGLLMYNDRIVIPQSLQKETMMKIHEGHQGIERCRIRVKSFSMVARSF